jgi:hypothetical protein
VTIDEFFVGNSELGSIGCNLVPTPSPEQFYTVLRGIADRPDVHDIRVQITAFDVPEWPFSDTIFIMTSAPPEEVATWFPEELKPDETWSGFTNQSYEPYTVPSGSQPVACWWD